jgi:ATP-binding cassette subfamily C protein LapB
MIRSYFLRLCFFISPMIGAGVMNSQRTLPVSGKSNLTRLFDSLRADVMAVSLVMHVLALALPLALLQIYDRILPAQAYGTAVFLIIGVGVAIVLEAILRYGRQALFANIGARYEAQMTLQALDRLQHADIAKVEQLGVAAVSDALRAIAQVRDFWSGQAGAALYEAPFVVVYIGLIAYVGGWLALIPLGLFFAAMVIAIKWNPRIAAAAKTVEVADRQRHDFSWTTFAALDYLKAMGAEGSVGALWRRINARYMARSAELETRMGWVRENAAAFGQLSTVLIVAFGAGSVVAGELTTGALAACTMLAGRSIGPAMSSLGYWSQLARVGEAQQRVDDLLALPDAPTFVIENNRAGPAISRGELRIEAPELFGAPVTIAPGEIVSLDTAETPLASRLLTAISGMTTDPGIRVTLDGRDITEFNHADYLDAVTLVSRHLALVPGSILNNLTLYDARYNGGVQAYCEALGLQAHLDKLRHGVLTEVGPGTAEHLDEGIYQRIAIIRALLRKPRILLLDHAASGIDLDGVKRLGDVLKSLQGHTTVLIASYKEPLIAACNRTLVLGKQGEQA